MLFCLALQSQPVVSEFWIPQIGDNWKQTVTNAIPAYGPSGAQVQWDFSGIDSSGFVGSFAFSWIDTTGTPYIDSFPEANICAKSGGGSFASYNYYRADDQGFHYLGGGNQFEIQILFETQTFNYIGLEFGETAIDSYKVVVYNSFSDPDTTLGFSSFEYDGYGTLLVPGISIDEAIRIHEYDVRYDSTDNFGSPSVVIDSLETYAWIAEGSVFPVAQWQRSVTYTRQYILGNLFSEDVDGPDTIFAYNPDYSMPSAVKSIADLPKLVSYPSLVDNMITIEGLPLDYQLYRIYSTDGCLVDRGHVNGNVIDVPEISPGSYVVTIGGYRPFLFVKR